MVQPTEKEWIELFKSKFDYVDGGLYWKQGLLREGKRVGYTGRGGYIQIRLNYAPKKSKLFFAHRIIFAMFNGHIPKLIDHIDRNPTNNRVENLREADKFINAVNTGLPCTNTSGVKGVYFHVGKWEAFIHYKPAGGIKRKIHLGRFNDKEDAIKARKQAERDYGFNV